MYESEVTSVFRASAMLLMPSNLIQTLRKTTNKFIDGLPKLVLDFVDFFTELCSIDVKFDSGFGRPPTNSYWLRKTANEFVGGLPKGLSQIRRHY